MFKTLRTCLRITLLVFACITEIKAENLRMIDSAKVAGVRKIQDLIIYQDPKFHAAFPSVVKVANGDFLLAFRRAPDRQQMGESKTYHVDPNSYLVALRSKDGINWTKEPELIYAHAFGGSQDPC